MKRTILVALMLLVALPAAGGEIRGDKELWKAVTVVMNPALVEECEFVGLVDAKANATVWYGYKKKQRAHRKIRKAALKLDANTVLLFQNKNNAMGTKLVGEAYWCAPLEVE